MNTVAEYGPFWGMHLFWWGFWILAMVSVFGFNVPERARVNSLDPHIILRRRFAKGDISEDEYKKITAQLRSDEESVQRDLTTQTSHAGVAGHPITDGLSFSATWAILYSLCTALYWIAPGAMLTATSKLFHGMSFTQMVQAGTPFGFGDFVSVLTLGAVYTFSAGIIWSLIHSYALRQRAERRLKRIETRTVQKAQLSPQAR
jgi:putative membrane protein